MHHYASDLDIELAALRARLMSTGAALAKAGRAIDDACFEHRDRKLEAQAELAATVQRNALAAGAMVADLLFVAGQLAGVSAAVTEVQS
ncbi:MAG TPA: hypothetical protein VF989_06690 [Polyangiaceae bacterium]